MPQSAGPEPEDKARVQRARQPNAHDCTAVVHNALNNNCASPTAVVTTSSHFHASCVDMNAPIMLAARIAVTRLSWLHAPRAPFSRGGDISLRYSGLSTAAVPLPRPIRKRPAMRNRNAAGALPK